MALELQGTHIKAMNFSFELTMKNKDSWKEPIIESVSEFIEKNIDKLESDGKYVFSIVLTKLG
jgi:hypothetical protein